MVKKKEVVVVVIMMLIILCWLMYNAYNQPVLVPGIERLT